MSTPVVQNAFDWISLPHEMKTAVLDHLSLEDVWSCAQSSRDSYALCLPILFRIVNLPTLESLNAFLEAVPAHHCQLIRDLRISTQSQSRDHDQCDAFMRPTSPCSDASAPLAELLNRCTGLEAFDIKICGGLDARKILPVFQGSGMERLKKLRIENLEMEEVAPISERLIVALAFSLPCLESLSLTRITRSNLHAPELHFSNIPLAQDKEGNSNLPTHPFLGDELRLPQLLRLPKLKQLQIRDTHLGDPMWEEVYSECPLEVLDLGSCAYVNPTANEAFTARILARAPPSITSCALSASLPPVSATSPISPTTVVGSPLSPTCKSSSFSPISMSPATTLSPSSPFSSIPQSGFSMQTAIPALSRLRTLHLTPLVPTSSISTTLSQPALAASPVQTLSCAFHPDDAAEGCRELEGFFKERGRLVALSQGLGQIQGRKRALSRLSMHVQTAEDIPIAESGRARSNTLPILRSLDASSVLKLTPSPIVTPACPYASLSTLTIDIPDTPASPVGMKMPPRRLAAARRRAAERREAAIRLREVAQGQGMKVVLKGVDLDSEESGNNAGAIPTAVSGKVSTSESAWRGRANSA
ncbi:hypothetical protein ACEPAI_3018 [Sanghuangporus weigelae]